MKKLFTVKQGGVLGRTLQHANKIKKASLMLLGAIAILFTVTLIDAGINSLQAKSFGATALCTGVAVAAVKKDEDASAELKELVKNFNLKQDEFKTLLEKKADAATIEAKQKEMADLNEKRMAKLDEVMLKQGEALAKFIEKGEDHRAKSFADRLTDLFTKNKDGIKKFGEGSGSKFNMDLNLTRKDILAANFVDITRDSFNVPGIGVQPVRRTFMEAIMSKSSQSGDAVRYVDQETIVRGADIVAGCAAYPVTSDITWKERILPWVKIGDMIHICKDQLEDHDYVMSEVQNLLTTNVPLKVDQQLLSGTGAGGQLLGILTTADAFVSAAPFSTNVVNPSIYDLINVVSAQLMNASFGYFMPNYVLMNPLDVALMGMSKDLQGGYIMPPFVTESGMRISGMRVIENSGVTQNTLVVGDFTKATIYDRKSMFIEMSTENVDNFEKDFVSIKCGRRLALVVRNVDANAFVKVTSISAAITAITKP